ncbi:hypothetical protein [Streptomyces sp. BF23-30]|uniref:hypothetical protein n=1 Tax=Streptomyces sp. BF23-30 TaxID=3240281 RepID=UPI0034E3B3A5
MEDVVDGEAHDSAEWLGIEQDDHACDPSAKRQVRVGEKAPDQFQSLGLRHWSGPADLNRRKPERPSELAGRAPEQEGSHGVAGVFVLLSVPGIDAGLAAGAEGVIAIGEPGQEGCGLFDPVRGMSTSCWRDRLLLSVRPQMWEHFPGSEPADDLGIVWVGDADEMTNEPPFERADLFVDDGQGTAGHQEFPQMGGGSPRFKCVEGFVSQLDVASTESS